MKEFDHELRECPNNPRDGHTLLHHFLRASDGRWSVTSSGYRCPRPPGLDLDEIHGRVQQMERRTS